MIKLRQMRVRATALTLAAAAVAAVMALPAFAATGGTERPYKLSGNQTGYYDTNTGYFDLVGPVIGSHLGKGSDRTFNLVSGAADIYTAANGDKLYGTDGAELPTDLVCPDVPGFYNFGPFRHYVNYAGGTGRFANATGTVVSDNCLYFGAEISPGVYTFYVTFSERGTLSY